MKSFALLFALAWSSCLAFSQGAFLFSNFGAGVNAPVTDRAGHPLNGPAFAADLYWAYGVVTDSRFLIPLGQPARFLTNGYFFGGERTIPPLGGGGSMSITAQVRVWNANDYPTWENASGGLYGFSGVSQLFIITLSALPYPPNVLTSLQPFAIGDPLACHDYYPFISVPLRILNNTNTVLLTWPANECGFIVVQENSTVNSTNWISITNDFVLVGLTNEIRNQILLPAPASNVFYRLVREP